MAKKSASNDVLSVSLPTKSLRDALSRIAPALSSRTPRPELGGIHVELLDGAAIFSATNLRAQVRARVEIEPGLTPSAPSLQRTAEGVAPPHGCGAEHVFLVGPKLAEVAAKARSLALSLEFSAESLTVRAGKSRATVPTMDVANYVELIPWDHSDLAATIQAHNLGRVVKRCAPCASEEGNGIYALDSIQLAASGGTLTAAATDGRRLMTATAPCSGDLRECLASLDISGVCRGMDGELRVGMVKGQIVIRSATTLAAVSLIEGRFPTWREMIPSESPPFLVDPRDLAGALAEAAVMTTVESRAVVFRIGPKEIALHAKAAGLGEADAVCSIEDGPDEELATAFNPKYLAPVLATLTAEAEEAERAEEAEGEIEEGGEADAGQLVGIEVTTSDKPLAIRRPAAQGVAWTFVAAPVRVRES